MDTDCSNLPCWCCLLCLGFLAALLAWIGFEHYRLCAQLPSIGAQELLGSVNDQKTDLAARSKGFLLAQDGEQDCTAGNAGSGKERWETHWLCSTWSLGKDRVIWERTEGSAWLVGLDTLLFSLKCLNCIVIIIIIIIVITL